MSRHRASGCLATLLLLLGSSAATPLSSLQSRTAELPRIPAVDSDVASAVVRELWLYYHWIPGSRLGGESPFGTTCRADEDDLCFEGDPESHCQMLRCHTDRQTREFVERLSVLARQHPDSPHAMTQAIYAAVRLGWNAEAGRLVEICADHDAWWCQLARGYVLHRSGRTLAAEEPLRRGLEAAPPDLRCRLEDIAYLLPDPARKRYEEVPCNERGAIHRHVWWLADPFWIDDVVDRWAEHVARRFELLLHEERLEATAMPTSPGAIPRKVLHRVVHERNVVRRGPADSWDIQLPPYRAELVERMGYTGRKAAANHFVPDALSLTALDTTVTWRLEADLDDEGYTRRDGAASIVPAQIARFREGDSLEVALASRPDVDLPGGRAFFVASAGPESDLATLAPQTAGRRIVFAATLPDGLQAVSLEVFAQRRLARHRTVLPPLEGGRPVLSDLLLFRPHGPDLPERRAEAIGQMFGSTRVPQGTTVGIYWEAYGIPADEVVRIALTLEGDEGGVLARLGRVVGIGGQPLDRTLAWSEETGGERPFAQSFTLDLGDLNRGEIVLTLRMELADGRWATRSRRLEVVESPEP